MKIRHSDLRQVVVVSDHGTPWAEITYRAGHAVPRVTILSEDCPLTEWEIIAAAGREAEAAVRTAEARIRDS